MLSGHSSGTTVLNKNPNLAIGVKTLQEDERKTWILQLEALHDRGCQCPFKGRFHRSN